MYWFIGAATLGSVHAAFSLYWAAGGTWLLRSVGQWAVTIAADDPHRAALILGAAAVVKGAVALLPLCLAAAATPIPRSLRRLLWRLLWLVSAALVVYGAVNTVAALAVLTGVIEPAGGYDRPAMAGHAYLWDPLFLFWGLLLAMGLASSSDRVTRKQAERN